ncbi:MAG: hypothetical protein MK212_00090 [Saprospiraceae bacterium]|nr:hypothetical protein [Saprospiraceae bacterium]
MTVSIKNTGKQGILSPKLQVFNGEQLVGEAPSFYSKIKVGETQTFNITLVNGQKLKDLRLEFKEISHFSKGIVLSSYLENKSYNVEIGKLNLKKIKDNRRSFLELTVTNSGNAELLNPQFAVYSDEGVLLGKWEGFGNIVAGETQQFTIPMEIQELPKKVKVQFIGRELGSFKSFMTDDDYMR